MPNGAHTLVPGYIVPVPAASTDLLALIGFGFCQHASELAALSVSPSCLLVVQFAVVCRGPPSQYIQAYIGLTINNVALTLSLSLLSPGGVPALRWD